jgi:uncharacterized protein involved in outer membrane biogenesis
VIRRLLIGVVLGPVLILAIAAGFLYWFLTRDAAQRAVEQQASAWLGQPVRIGDATVTFLPRLSVRLQNVAIGTPAVVTLSQIDAVPEIRPLLSRRLEVRSVALRDVRLAGHGRDIDVSADFAGAPGQLTLTRLDARSGRTVVRATGIIRFAARVEAVIDARADLLDADDLLALVDAFASSLAAARAPTSAMPPRITATISAPAGTVAGVAIRRIDATVHADGPQVSIEPLTFDVFGGRHTGWFDVGIGDTLDVRLGASVNNIDAAQLSAFAGVPGAMSGRFGASARLGARGRDLSAVLGSLRGAGEVLVVDGALRGLNLVETVVRFLGRAPRGSSADGTPFARLSANFAMGDALVRTDDLTLHSSDFDIFGRGTLRLDSEALDGRADVVLSPALSAQANPAVYRYARTGDRVVLPGTIAGTLARPQVRFDAGAAIQRAIGNEIERRLSDLLDVIRRPQ